MGEKDHLNEGNALRWQMQSFAMADAKLCVGSCKALRWQLQCFASEMGKTGTEIVCHILDMRKGRKDSPYGDIVAPRKVLLSQHHFIYG